MSYLHKAVLQAQALTVPCGDCGVGVDVPCVPLNRCTGRTGNASSEACSCGAGVGEPCQPDEGAEDQIVVHAARVIDSGAEPDPLVYSENGKEVVTTVMPVTHDTVFMGGVLVAVRCWAKRVARLKPEETWIEKRFSRAVATSKRRVEAVLLEDWSNLVGELEQLWIGFSGLYEIDHQGVLTFHLVEAQPLRVIAVLDVRDQEVLRAEIVGSDQGQLEVVHATAIPLADGVESQEELDFEEEPAPRRKKRGLMDALLDTLVNG